MADDSLRLTAVLQPRGPAAAVVLTDDQIATLGGTKTPPVRFTIGATTLRGRIGRMGGENLLGFNKSVRGQLGVEAGDTVDILIELDTDPREVDLPPALAAALDADPALRAAFERIVAVAQKRACAFRRRGQTQRNSEPPSHCHCRPTESDVARLLPRSYAPGAAVLN